MNALERLRKKQADENLPALLISNLVNIGYLSGFTGDNATLLVTPEVSTLFTDSRYTLQAEMECPGFQVDTENPRVLEAAADEIHKLGIMEIGFEEENLTVRQFSCFQEKLGDVKTIPLRNVVEDLRVIKDEKEIELIRKAVDLTDKAFDHILSFIRVGVTERDIAVELDFYIRRHGGKEGFETIVASGRRAALPHAQPTNKQIAEGEMVKMDFGALLNGYNGDLTRAVSIGSPDHKLRQIYGIVLNAQEQGIDAIRPGITGRDADLAARKIITQAGYGDNFTHALGHSLGREVHDGPALSTRSETVLQPGMVFTVEPGIYIEGWGGIRIEDDVLVTETGHEVLTKAPKSLMSVG